MYSDLQSYIYSYGSSSHYYTLLNFRNGSIVRKFFEKQNAPQGGNFFLIMPDPNRIVRFGGFDDQGSADLRGENRVKGGQALSEASSQIACSVEVNTEGHR